MFPIYLYTRLSYIHSDVPTARPMRAHARAVVGAPSRAPVARAGRSRRDGRHLGQQGAHHPRIRGAVLVAAAERQPSEHPNV